MVLILNFYHATHMHTVTTYSVTHLFHMFGLIGFHFSFFFSLIFRAATYEAVIRKGKANQ